LEPLKNVYSPVFLQTLVNLIRKQVPTFDGAGFRNDVNGSGWQQMELKQRMRHISRCLRKHLPGGFKEQLTVICYKIEELKQSSVRQNTFAWICLPDFIEEYGLENVNASLDAMEKITAFISCEFAVRPFLLSDPGKVMKRMLKWSRHADPNVRRFSSEGCRPRLPWGKAIPSLKKDPASILPILENLKADPSEFVRKSVANNINDIAKDNPEVVIQLIRKWKGGSPETDWILKHGARTLLRKANADVYKEFGLSGVHNCKVGGFKIAPQSILLGDAIEIQFTLTNEAKKAQLFRLELGVYYVKSSGKPTRKLFKITEKTFEPGVSNPFKRKLSFTDLTTRKHYAGKHSIAIVVNGNEIAKKVFSVAVS
jgi:3-methyladenine DNA glycosylase AlkC